MLCGSGSTLCDGELQDKTERQIYNNRMLGISDVIDTLDPKYRQTLVKEFKHEQAVKRVDSANAVAAYSFAAEVLL